MMDDDPSRQVRESAPTTPLTASGIGRRFVPQPVQMEEEVPPPYIAPASPETLARDANPANAIAAVMARRRMR